ncbi:hypothetical protein RA177_17305 [Bacillus safensis]|uniref:hypothetical protein n=1 Tax=Bacillus safensis TaxID=561879 RepID=UPI0027BB0951|nr:hypothetical protein [Bacillus safensis]WLW69285.1 hypothetical protein RA177_17305 [Bacillus safensis]
MSLFTTYYPLFMLCVLSVLYVMYRIQPLASTVKKIIIVLCVLTNAAYIAGVSFLHCRMKVHLI